MPLTTMPRRIVSRLRRLESRLRGVVAGETGDIDTNRRAFLHRAGAATGAGVGAYGLTGTTAAHDHEDLTVSDCDGLSRRSLAELPWSQRDIDGSGRSASDDYGGWVASQHFADWDIDVDEATSGKTPIVYAHGNTGDACHFEEHAHYMLESGWAGEDLYAITFAEPTATHDEMANQLDDFVSDVRAYLEAEHGYTGDLAFVGHSLGVTGIRWWVHRAYVTKGEAPPMETFVGLAGPNHGTPACDITCWFSDCRDWSESAYNSITGWLDPGEVCQNIGEDCTDEAGAVLAELNSTGGETPTSAGYYTVRSPQDPLYTTFGCGYNPDSPRLAGAEQNFEYGYDDDIDHGDTLRGNNFDSCLGDCPPEPPELVEQWVE